MSCGFNIIIFVPNQMQLDALSPFLFFVIHPPSVRWMDFLWQVSTQTLMKEQLFVSRSADKQLKKDCMNLFHSPELEIWPETASEAEFLLSEQIAIVPVFLI